MKHGAWCDRHECSWDCDYHRMYRGMAPHDPAICAQARADDRPGTGSTPRETVMTAYHAGWGSCRDSLVVAS